MWISSVALLMRVERGTTQVYTTNLLSETSVDAVKEGASQPRDVESLQYQQPASPPACAQIAMWTPHSEPENKKSPGQKNS